MSNDNMQEVQKAVPKKYKKGSETVEGWEKILRNVGIAVLVLMIVIPVTVSLFKNHIAGQGSVGNKKAYYQIAVNGKWVPFYNVTETDSSIYGEWRVPDGSERFVRCENTSGSCDWGEGLDESTATLRRNAPGNWSGTLNYGGAELKAQIRRR